MLLVWAAANLDEREFEDPERFDVTRKVVRHLAFGHGVHFCLGASLARMEARVAFEELFARHPDYELVREPGWVHSRWARAHGEIELAQTLMGKTQVNDRAGISRREHQRGNEDVAGTLEGAGPIEGNADVGQHPGIAGMRLQQRLELGRGEGLRRPGGLLWCTRDEHHTEQYGQAHDELYVQDLCLSLGTDARVTGSTFSREEGRGRRKE